ncbi:MAG: dethiobiotin synthetase [Actinomycetota bacterium]|jgi:dethiobiotin synthetase|nr:dethiobiotin synthetase [Actinomycetota bacterium]
MIVVVSATGTEIGKTWFTARTIEMLRRRGIEAHARKPVQSFEPGEVTDAEILARASGDHMTDVCRHSYEFPLAPPMAARVLGKPEMRLIDILWDLHVPETGITFVEGVGGPRSPLASDGDTVTLASSITADVIVLVAQAELGVINDVRLGIDAFAPHRVVVALNRFDPMDEMHTRNRDWLRTEVGAEVVTSPSELADLFAALQMEVG